jgi:hypothetical protein
MGASVVSLARIGSLRATVRGWWAEARGYQRLAYVVGAGLILIDLAHAGLWALAGGSASGAVSWRKPATFGISFGLTTVTLAWVTGHLRITDRTGSLLLGPLAAATSYEVAWAATSTTAPAGAGQRPGQAAGRGELRQGVDDP